MQPSGGDTASSCAALWYHHSLLYPFHLEFHALPTFSPPRYRPDQNHPPIPFHLELVPAHLRLRSTPVLRRPVLPPARGNLLATFVVLAASAAPARAPPLGQADQAGAVRRISS